jgi:hypothetical protein
MSQVEVTEPLQRAMQRALLGGGLVAWWGRSSVRITCALLLVRGAGVATAAGAAGSIAVVLLVMAAPEVLLTAVHLWRVQDARRVVRRRWPVGTTHAATFASGRLVLTGPDGDEVLDLSDLHDLHVTEEAAVLRLRPLPFVLPRALVAPDALSWMGEVLLARRPGGPWGR